MSGQPLTPQGLSKRKNAAGFHERNDDPFGGPGRTVEENNPTQAVDSVADGDAERPDSVARLLDSGAAPPPWNEQITVRGVIVGAGIGMLFCIITMRLCLGTAGIVPSLNVPGGLLSFVALRGTTVAGNKLGFRKGLFAPFGVQENTVVQTFVSSCYSVAFTGGFGTYLTGMSYQAYLNTGGVPRGKPGYDPSAVFEPDLHRVIPYMLLVSIVGIFTLTSLRKLMILDWKLPFPSGTATGIMLNSFHSKSGEVAAMKKINTLMWSSIGSFLFEVFKWPFQGADYGCGFASFPTFGMKAYDWTWHFDFNESYVGSGMICPHIVNWSMLLGAIISWGIMWPLITQRAGDWFPAELDSHDFKGLFGYKVFLTIATTMGEGVYMLGRVLYTASRDFVVRLKQRRAQRHLGASVPGSKEASVVVLDQHEDEFHHADRKSLLEFRETSEERELRTRVFLADPIPDWISPVGYIIFSVLAIGIIPVIYPPVKWYLVLVALILAPMLALPNSYGCGLTDWDNCSMFGKLALFAIAGWAGPESGGVIAGLGVCGVVLSACSSAAVLMQDFRTGYITTSSPRAMLVSQIIGSVMGCFFAPLAFAMIWSTGQVGVRGTPYENPFADIYRSMAKLGTEGFGALPKHCGTLIGVFFAASVAMCAVRDLLPPKYGKFVPSPMAMGIPFYIGANNAINFWLGSVITHFWAWVSKAGADEYGPIVGAGLLVGSGVFSIPSALLSIGNVAPPICMSFKDSFAPAAA